MADEFLPETPHLDGAPRETIPTPKEKPTRRLNILQIEKRFAATFSIMAKVLVIVLIAVAVIFVVRELHDDGYVISQINVPASFQDIGYSGPVVAKRIDEKLNRIIEITRSAAEAEGYTDRASRADVSVDMLGFGLPVGGVIELIGNALGIEPKKKISADITVEANVMALVISITGEPPERVEAPMDDNVGVPLKTLIAAATEVILKHTNDGVLSLYYSNQLSDGEKVVRLAKYSLEKHKGYAALEANAQADWAFGLLLQNKLDAAEEKIKQGLAVDPNYYRYYGIWGDVYKAKREYPEALAMLKKAYTLLPADASNSMRSRFLSNRGATYSYNGKSDSAIADYRKSLEYDDKFSYAHYNLSYEYLIKGDTTRCLDEVEKALACGLNIKTILIDPDMTTMLNHPRLKKLLLKYAEE